MVLHVKDQMCKTDLWSFDPHQWMKFKNWRRKQETYVATFVCMGNYLKDIIWKILYNKPLIYWQFLPFEDKVLYLESNPAYKLICFFHRSYTKRRLAVVVYLLNDMHLALYQTSPFHSTIATSLRDSGNWKYISKQMIIKKKKAIKYCKIHPFTISEISSPGNARTAIKVVDCISPVASKYLWRSFKPSLLLPG